MAAKKKQTKTEIAERKAMVAAATALGQTLSFDNEMDQKQATLMIIEALQAISEIGRQAGKGIYIDHKAVLFSAVYASMVGIDLEDVHPRCKGGQQLQTLCEALNIISEVGDVIHEGRSIMMGMGIWLERGHLDALRDLVENGEINMKLLEI